MSVLQSIKSILTKLRELNFFSTIYINFITFSFDKAILFPILIFGRVNIKNARKGKLVFDCPLKTGLLQIGKHGLGFLDKRNCCTIWNIAGILYISGKARIGQGGCVEVGENATMTFGRDFNVTGRSVILCSNHITFVDGCLLSWDLLIMDKDWHSVISTVDGSILNLSKPINVGNHVWIGCRSTILKGVNISDNVIVAANSTISRSIDKEFVAVSGNGVLREDVRWEY